MSLAELLTSSSIFRGVTNKPLASSASVNAAASITVGTPIAQTGTPRVSALSAARLLPTPEPGEMPVSQICTQVGYNDLKHFNQTFRKETELSPGQYRKLYG